MKLQAYAPEPLNNQASIVVNAQTDIKTAIKRGIFGGMSTETVRAEVDKIIERAVKKITNPTLRIQADDSLKKFADNLYKRTRQIFPYISVGAVAVVSLYKAVKENAPKGEKTLQTAVQQVVSKYPKVFPTYETQEKGIPLQEYTKTYIDRVDKALDEIVQEQAKDTEDITERNSLRNKAEMLVRKQRHDEEIADFKAKGTKLVVCSVHADCSDRCKNYQGKIYSLDSTYGKTADGRSYEPLENATNNPKDRYTTKKGITYQNGLFGFNCRHKLFEFNDGMVIPYVSEETRKREDAITRQQRALEREVIHFRELALTLKGIDEKGYKMARQQAIESMREYKEFCEKNNRPYYLDRVKIL